LISHQQILSREMSLSTPTKHNGLAVLFAVAELLLFYLVYDSLINKINMSKVPQPHCLQFLYIMLFYIILSILYDLFHSVYDLFRNFR